MLRLGLVLLILPPLGLMGAYFLELGDVRECQLVQQGHWDYLAGVCRDAPQPFVPWIDRRPWLVNGGLLLSLAGLAMCLAGRYVRRR